MQNRTSRGNKGMVIGLSMLLAFTGMIGTAQAEDWDIYLTVDNAFDIYFGTPTTTTHHAGSGNSWYTEYNYTATGRAATDYVYVSTASDQQVANAFIGEFRNLTTGAVVATGDVQWEVFPAGQYAAQLGLPDPWPYDTSGNDRVAIQPTQSQVDTAIAYAEANGLWVTPSYAPGYDNDPSTPIGAGNVYPWTNVTPPHLPNIRESAKWIWHDSGNNPGGGDIGPGAHLPAPYFGFNHDEFLVFRIAGAAVPEPTTMTLLALGGVAMLRRRR